MNIAAIPSPTTSVWHLLGFPVRAYAICIVLGIVAAGLIMEMRLRRRGVAPWASLDVAVWAVPFGIVGARVYHLISSPQAYFSSDGHPIDALKIWEGGLSIWGAVAGGALGAWIGCRQLGLPLGMAAEALAPGLPVGQAIGRLGNWFNNELYGKVTTLPWGLRVHDMDQSDPGHALTVDGEPLTKPDLYHPAFLYEALWDVGVAVLVLLLDRRFKFGRGRSFALYVMAYTAGRVWIEMLRIDEANRILGIRLNVFTSILVFLGALAYFLVVRGPRAYVVPVDAPDTADALAPTPESDVSQVDVAAPVADGHLTPRGYQVVSEEQFEAYRRTGVLPPADHVPDPPDEAPDPPDEDTAEPADVAAVSSSVSAAPPAAADDEPAADRPGSSQPADD